MQLAAGGESCNVTIRKTASFEIGSDECFGVYACGREISYEGYDSYPNATYILDGVAYNMNNLKIESNYITAEEIRTWNCVIVVMERSLYTLEKSSFLKENM